MPACACTSECAGVERFVASKLYTLHGSLIRCVPSIPTLHCSRCKDRFDQAIGTKEDWVEEGAPAGRWWELIYADPADAELYAAGGLAGCFCPWLPPMRGKVLRSLKSPEFSKSPCNFQACKWKGCCGNITYWDKDGNLWFK